MLKQMIATDCLSDGLLYIDALHYVHQHHTITYRVIKRGHHKAKVLSEDFFSIFGKVT